MSIHDLCEDQEQWAMQTLMGSGVLARCRIHNDVILDSGNDASSAYKLGTYLYQKDNSCNLFNTLTGFAPIFPDICYHLTHYKPAAADIPV
ncbi:hypothetical protein N6O32_24405, partial [Escherichia coli]